MCSKSTVGLRKGAGVFRGAPERGVESCRKHTLSLLNTRSRESHSTETEAWASILAAVATCFRRLQAYENPRETHENGRKSLLVSR